MPSIFNLNEDAVAELKAFILANPQLEIDLEEMELPSFLDEELKVDFKNELKFYLLITKLTLDLD